MIKIAFIFSGILLFTQTVPAQSGSWTIQLNKKTIISTDTENKEVNCKKIKSSAWNKPGRLSIRFTENEPDTWFRSFLFYDENDQELLRKDSTTAFTLSFSELKKIFTGKSEINIFTVVAPVDPTIAIRMRRVHLCTLRLP